MNLNNRLERLEGRVSLELAESPEHREARARMRVVLGKIAAARRDGREPSEEATAIMEVIKWRRERGA